MPEELPNRGRLLWIDLEMTGLDLKSDRILEIAASRFYLCLYACQAKYVSSCDGSGSHSCGRGQGLHVMYLSESCFLRLRSQWPASLESRQAMRCWTTCGFSSAALKFERSDVLPQESMVYKTTWQDWLDSSMSGSKLGNGRSGIGGWCDRSLRTMTDSMLKEMLAWIKERMPDSMALLAGSSVHVDKTFLVSAFFRCLLLALMLLIPQAKDMPKIHEHLHYRILDVSSIKGQSCVTLFRMEAKARSTEAVKRFHPHLRYQGEAQGDNKPHRWGLVILNRQPLTDFDLERSTISSIQ